METLLLQLLQGKGFSAGSCEAAGCCCVKEHLLPPVSLLEAVWVPKETPACHVWFVQSRQR